MDFNSTVKGSALEGFYREIEILTKYFRTMIGKMS